MNPIIVYDILYNSTIESSSIFLLRSDIYNITDFPLKAKILVKFKDDSSDINCTKHLLFGRLWWKCLTVIHWYHADYEKDKVHHCPSHLKAFNKTNRTDLITGYYQVPSPGRYFVEIIGIFLCDFSFDFDFNPIRLVPLETIPYIMMG